MSFNLATILTSSAETFADKTLVHLGDTNLSYAQVDEYSGRVAASLEQLGLHPGDKVAVQLPNVPQFLFAYFGILKAGLIMVPLNPLLTAPEIAYHLADSDARILITFEGFAAAALDGAHEAGDIPTFVLSLSSAPVPAPARSFTELLVAADTGILHQTSADDTAVLIYTSGTTGRPKGAELTHFQLFMNCTTAGELFGITPEDVSLAVLPFFHVFGLSSVLDIAVRFGATLVLVPRFDAEAVVTAMERHRCTVFSGVPTMYIALLQHDITGRDLSSWRAAISGGSSIPGEIIKAFEQKYGAVILEGYGLSETASTTTFNASVQERKVLSVGKPVWGVGLRIVDRHGHELGAGPDQIGEIVVRGHNVMKGYYKRPEATLEAMRNGWFHTGDLGYRDDDGFVFIVDRLKELVIRGGYNVYPREVEEVLYQHPDVVEAAVVGRPDERLGEEVVAYVVLRQGPGTTVDDLTTHCKARLASYKYPRVFVVMDDLPKGATGKVLKRELVS